MGLSWNSSRGPATRRKGKEAPVRARGRTKWGTVEALEGRCLLAVTSTTPVPITVIEASVFNGPVMNFTANDAGPFTATITWGDLTISAGVVTPVAGGFAVNGTHTYAEDGFLYRHGDDRRHRGRDHGRAHHHGDRQRRSPDRDLRSLHPTREPGAPTVTTGTFTDPGSPDPGSSYTASIDWGDGTTTPGTVVRTGRAAL